jgi:hypothetical protein
MTELTLDSFIKDNILLDITTSYIEHIGLDKFGDIKPEEYEEWLKNKGWVWEEETGHYMNDTHHHKYFVLNLGHTLQCDFSIEPYTYSLVKDKATVALIHALRKGLYSATNNYISQYYIVSGTLAESLLKEEEPILELNGLTIWQRRRFTDLLQDMSLGNIFSRLNRKVVEYI